MGGGVAVRGRRRRDVAHQPGIADVAAHPFGGRRRGVAEVAQDRLPPATVLLDEPPDRPVLAPAGALGVGRRGPAGGERTAVPGHQDPPAQPVGARGVGLEEARPRQVPHQRGQPLDVAPHALGQLAGGDVVALAAGAPHQRLRQALEVAVVHSRALDEEHVQALVPALREQQRARRPPVAPGPAGLLVVGLHGAGDGGVGHRPHVRLVDPHAEGVGGDHHRRAAVHEPALGVSPLGPAQARVVGDRRGAERRGELARQPLRRGPRARVDDGRERVGLAQRRHQPRPLVGDGAAGDDGERQVGTIEAGGDTDGIAQPQAPDHVARHVGGRGGGGRQDGARPQMAGGVGQPEVVRAEVVPPLRDAVSLVHHEQPDARPRHRLQEPGRREALGRHVQQPQPAGGRRLQRRPVGRGLLLGVDQRHLSRRPRPQGLHLVVHERDQGRDHDRQPVVEQRGELVAERLAGSGRHQREDTLAAQHRADHVLLAGPERLVAEDLPKGIPQPFGRQLGFHDHAPSSF